MKNKNLKQQIEIKGHDLLTDGLIIHYYVMGKPHILRVEKEMVCHYLKKIGFIKNWFIELGGTILVDLVQEMEYDNRNALVEWHAFIMGNPVIPNCDLIEIICMREDDIKEELIENVKEYGLSYIALEALEQLDSHDVDFLSSQSLNNLN